MSVFLIHVQLKKRQNLRKIYIVLWLTEVLGIVWLLCDVSYSVESNLLKNDGLYHQVPMCHAILTLLADRIPFVCLYLSHRISETVGILAGQYEECNQQHHLKIRAAGNWLNYDQGPSAARFTSAKKQIRQCLSSFMSIIFTVGSCCPWPARADGLFDWTVCCLSLLTWSNYQPSTGGHINSYFKSSENSLLWHFYLSDLSVESSLLINW